MIDKLIVTMILIILFILYIYIFMGIYLKTIWTKKTVI